MATKSLTFRLFGIDVNASRTIRGVGDAAHFAGSSFIQLNQNILRWTAYAGLAAVATAALGAVAVGVAGFIGVALAGAFVAMGIMAIKGNAQVKGAFDDMKKSVQNTLNAVSGPLVTAVVNGLHRISAAFAGMKPELHALFAAMAPLVTIMVNGVINAMHMVVPAITSFLNSVRPLVTVFAQQLGPLLVGFIQGIRNMLAPLAQNAGAFRTFIQVLIQVWVHLGTVMGTLVKLGAQVLPQVGRILIILLDALNPIIVAFGKLAIQIFPMLIPVLQKVVNLLSGGLAKILPIMGQAIIGMLPSIAKLVELFLQFAVSVLPVLLPPLTLIVRVIADSLAKALPQLLPPLLSVIRAFANWLPTLIPLINPLIQIVAAVIKILPPISQLAIKILNALMPAINELLPPLAAMVDKIGGALAQAILKASPFIVQFAKALSDILTALIPLLPGLTKLLLSVLPLLPAMTQLAAVVARALVPIIGVLVIGINALMPVIQFLARLVVTVLVVAIHIWIDVINVIMGILRTFARVVGDVAAFIARNWRHAWQDVVDFFKHVVNDIKDFAVRNFDAIKANIIRILNDIKTFFIRVWNDVKDFCIRNFDAIKANIIRILNDIKKFWIDAWQSVKKWFEDRVNDVKRLANDGLTWIQGRFSSIVGTLKRNWNNDWAAVKNWFHDRIEDIKRLANDGITWVQRTIGRITGDISKAWSRVWGDMRDAAKRLWNDIQNTFKGPIKGIIGFVNILLTGAEFVLDHIGLKGVLNDYKIPTSGLAKGARIPGYGGGDSVHAMLEPGETVVPKHLTPEIAKWAAWRGIPGFQIGGLVQQHGSPILPPGSTQAPGPIIGAKPGPPQTAGSGIAIRKDVQQGANFGLKVGDFIVSGVTGVVKAGFAALFKLGAKAAIAGIHSFGGQAGFIGQMISGLGDKIINGIVDLIKGKEYTPPAVGGIGLGSESGVSWPSIVAWMRKSGIPFTVTSTTGGSHAAGSYHYKGEAVDISDSAGNMVKLAQYAMRNVGSFLEIIHSGGGGIFAKNGKPVGASVYSAVIAEHFNHVHLAAYKNAIEALLHPSAAIGGGISPGGSLQNMAQAWLNKYGWSNQFPALNFIITHESGWSVSAHNPSGATGLGQALPASKMAPYGADYLTNPNTQLHWMMDYIKQRYGDPNAAQRFWAAHNWYGEGGLVKSFDAGGWLAPGLTLAWNGTGAHERVGGGDFHIHFHGPVFGDSRDVAKQLTPAIRQSIREAQRAEGRTVSV